MDTAKCARRPIRLDETSYPSVSKCSRLYCVVGVGMLALMSVDACNHKALARNGDEAQAYRSPGRPSALSTAAPIPSLQKRSWTDLRYVEGRKKDKGTILPSGVCHLVHVLSTSLAAPPPCVKVILSGVY